MPKKNVPGKSSNEGLKRTKGDEGKESEEQRLGERGAHISSKTSKGKNSLVNKTSVGFSRYRLSKGVAGRAKKKKRGVYLRGFTQKKGISRRETPKRRAPMWRFAYSERSGKTTRK